MLFNRFYQPDIDLASLALRRDLDLSTRAEIACRCYGLVSSLARLAARLPWPVASRLPTWSSNSCLPALIP